MLLIVYMYIGFYCFNNFYFFIRLVSSEQLLEKAESITNSRRQYTVTETERFLVPNIPEVWGEKKPVNKFAIAKSIAGFKYAPKGPNADTFFMEKFLKPFVDASTLVDPGLVKLEKMIPCQVPIIDFLRVSVKRNDGWNYPTKKIVDHWRKNRSFDREYPKGVKIMEIIAGEATEEEIKEFKNFVDENQERDQEDFPTGAISLDVEEIKISSWDLHRIVSMEEDNLKEIKLAEELGVETEAEKEAGVWEKYYEKDSWINLPAKIMFGNGYSWAALISLPMSQDESGSYIYRPCRLPSSIVDLLNNLPPAFGLGIKEDIKIITNVYSYLSNEQVSMKPFIDLECLAVLAGWRLEATNMAVMSMVTLGSAMNKVVSRGGGKWGIEYRLLPQSLQAYAIADLKFGHMTYNVLLGCLLREMFPDPDVCCKFSNVSQFDYSKWFCGWIIDVLQGTIVYRPPLQMADTREQLLLALRYRTFTGKPSADAPVRVKQVMSMLHGLVPTITNGGARYLHLARDHYVLQYELLYGMESYPEMFPAHLTEELRYYARFDRVSFSSVEWHLAVPEEYQEDLMKLVVPASLQHSVGKVRYPLSYVSFKTEADRLKRSMRPIVLEWARLSPGTRIPDLFKAFEKDVDFAKQFKGYYETLRLMYQYTVNRYPKCPEKSEKARDDHFVKRYNEEQDKLDALKAMYDSQVEIMSEMEKYVDPDPLMDRNGWKSLPFKPVGGKTKVVFAPTRGVKRSLEHKAQAGPPPVGRSLTDQVSDHKEPTNVFQELDHGQPWRSNEGANAHPMPSWDFQFQEPAAREPDEHEMRALATRKARTDVFMYPSTACGYNGRVSYINKKRPRMTQDEIEEDDLEHTFTWIE